MKWLGIGALGLLGLAVVALAVLWVMGQRAGAGRIQASIDIDRAPLEVWPWITEPEKEKAWVTFLVDVKTDGPVQTGSHQAWTLHDVNKGGLPVQIESETISAEPGRKLAVKLSSGMFTGSATYVLTDLGNGKTRLGCESIYQFNQALTRLLEPIVMSSAAKKFNGDLARLKSAAEASPLTTAVR